MSSIAMSSVLESAELAAERALNCRVSCSRIGDWADRGFARGNGVKDVLVLVTVVPKSFVLDPGVAVDGEMILVKLRLSCASSRDAFAAPTSAWAFATFACAC